MVSICIATYNSEKFIYGTLKSIQNQTYKDFEVVLVDDHSTDNTANIILEFCLTDKRFKLITNCTERAYVDSHNLSYELATGDLLFRLDNDDLIEPDYIEYMVNYMNEHPEVDTCCVAEDFNIYEDFGIYRENTITDDMAFGNPEEFNNDPAMIYYNACFLRTSYQYWHNNTSCLRKSFYDRVQPKYRVLPMGDGIFWMEVFCADAVAHKLTAVKMHKTNTHRNTYATEEYQNLTDECQYFATLAYSKYFNKRFDTSCGQEVSQDKINLRETVNRTFEMFKQRLIDSGVYDTLPEECKN